MKSTLIIILCISSLHTVEGFRGASVPLPATKIQDVPSLQKERARYRADAIRPDPQIAMSATSRAEGEEQLSRTTTVRRYYDNFLWKKNDRTTQDYNINYRVEGPVNGQPILLAHGFGANVNHFRFQFPALLAADEKYRVYAIDLLGFGASDKPNHADYSIELFVQLLEDFVQAMETKNNSNKKWIVAGNSIGGLCSLGLADRLSDRILGVVLFNTSGGMSSFRYDQIPLPLRPILWFVQKFVLGSPKLGGKFFENFKTRDNIQSILMTQGIYGNTTNVDDELLEILLGPSDDEGARDVFLKVFGGKSGPTPESFLAKIDCPILAIWGEADPWTVIAMGESIGKHAKHYHLEGLPSAGHCPHDEVPELVHQIMLPWLKELLSKENNTGGSTSSPSPTKKEKFQQKVTTPQ